jgi:predicted metal-binding protein
MLVFSAKYELEDSTDFEAMLEGAKDFRRIARNVDEAVKPQLSDYLILSNEGCDMCESCTYPDAPCRFPGRVQGSIEGYGIFVSKLAQQAGMRYNNGENTITYFGAMLYNSGESLEG